MINGVKIKKLEVHNDERGSFMELLRNEENLLEQIAQISLSIKKPGVINAFHYHEFQDDGFYVVNGNAKLVLYDPRKDSNTKGQIQEINLGEDFIKKIVFVPKKVLHGYKILGKKPATLICLASKTYDPENPDEGRIPFNNPEINYDWEK